QRLLEAPDSFPVDRAGEGLGTGLLKVGDRLRPFLSKEGMVGQSVDMLGSTVRIHSLDGLHDSHVESAPPVLKQATISHLMGQCMLESKLDIRKEFDLVQEFRGPQASDRGAQFILGDLGNSL